MPQIFDNIELKLLEGLHAVLPAATASTFCVGYLNLLAWGQLADLVEGLPSEGEARFKDLLGRVCEYFLSQFASAEGKKGGEFYTLRCVVKLLVEMIEPYRGCVYDPCCGYSGMFVQSVEFIRAHAKGDGNLPAPRLRQAGGGRAKADISISQESNYTRWRLAKMNLAIRGIDAQQPLQPHQQRRSGESRQ
jgi:type I restriction enzyme M protein